VEVSMMEIYNEQVVDLLVDSKSASASNDLPVLEIRQAADGTVNVPGLRQVIVCYCVTMSAMRMAVDSGD
jgi:hypothetical protein